MTIPSIEPEKIIAGDRVQWTHDDPERLPSSWTLTYSFRAKGSTIDVTATDNGDGTHLVSETAAVTVEWTPGEYYWQRHLTNGAIRETTAEGYLTVLPDFASAEFDPRSSVKRTLDTLQAMREGKATSDQTSMSINGRSISRMNWEEINAAYNHFAALYKQEQKQKQSDRGLEDKSGVVKVRFDNA